MPRLVEGRSAVVASINAAMDTLDADAVEGCSNLSREVTVKSSGPELLVINEYVNYFCGVYPFTGSRTYVFDLESGTPLDWSKALPGARISPESFSRPVDNTFESPILQARIVELVKADSITRAECLETITGASSLVVYFADDGRLDISHELPHAVQACATTLSLSADALLELRADPRLIAVVRRGALRGPLAPEKE
jgi:hypothetical protein